MRLVSAEKLCYVYVVVTNVCCVLIFCKNNTTIQPKERQIISGSVWFDVTFLKLCPVNSYRNRSDEAKGMS